MKWSLLAIFVLLTALATPARADDSPSRTDAGAKPAPAGPPAAPDKEGFVPVSDSDLAKARFDASVPAPELIAGAYGFIFAALALYVFRIGRRAHQLEGEMNDLRSRIETRLSSSNKAKT